MLSKYASLLYAKIFNLLAELRFPNMGQTTIPILICIYRPQLSELFDPNEFV